MNRPAQITVGQEVFIVRSSSFYSPSYTLGKVSRITPTGQVTVSVPNCSDTRFDRNDSEMGLSRNATTSRFLNWDVATIRAHIAEEFRVREAGAQLQKLVKEAETFNTRMSRREVIELITKLRKTLETAEGHVL